MYSLIKVTFTPVFLISSLLFFGILLLYLNKKKKSAIILLSISFILFFTLSFRPFSNYLLWGLESQYPPIMHFNDVRDIHYIVVLTAWASDNPTFPYTSKLCDRSLARVAEAHRIYTNLPGSKIIASGSDIGSQVMAQLLVTWGVTRENIIIDRAQNTWESAVNIKRLIQYEPFILVTSAIHMPRSINSFKKQELNVIAAPADYFYGYYANYEMPLKRPLRYFLPNMDSFWRSDLAIHEYLGLYWYNLSH